MEEGMSVDIGSMSMAVAFPDLCGFGEISGGFRFGITCLFCLVSLSDCCFPYYPIRGSS